MEKLDQEVALGRMAGPSTINLFQTYGVLTYTLLNVYVDLMVFTRIAGTS